MTDKTFKCGDVGLSRNIRRGDSYMVLHLTEDMFIILENTLRNVHSSIRKLNVKLPVRLFLERKGYERELLTYEDGSPRCFR